MGKYAFVAKAAASKGALFFLPGEYLVEIVAVKEYDGIKGLKFIVEARVLESNNPACPADTRTRSWVVDLSRRDMGGPGDVKAFICNMEGIAEEDFEEEMVDLAVDQEEAPFVGRQARLTVRDPKPGKKFTKHIWSTI
ncbi:MAG: hypothetical protein IPH07_23570 [Deltaproteobacteria bacterium]|nr:hypothetical protein [Deltaproteobacteria bacterium]MBK8241759.1 hypothetical protein [Deltaproteobacteria bacterium]